MRSTGADCGGNDVFWCLLDWAGFQPRHFLKAMRFKKKSSIGSMPERIAKLQELKVHIGWKIIAALGRDTANDITRWPQSISLSVDFTDGRAKNCMRSSGAAVVA